MALVLEVFDPQAKRWVETVSLEGSTPKGTPQQVGTLSHYQRGKRQVYVFYFMPALRRWVIARSALGVEPKAIRGLLLAARHNFGEFETVAHLNSGDSHKLSLRIEPSQRRLRRIRFTYKVESKANA